MIIRNACIELPWHHQLTVYRDTISFHRSPRAYARPPLGLLPFPPRLLFGREGLVDFLAGDLQVRSLNAGVSQHAVTIEAITISNVESYPGSFQVF
jgi:hypothetical protein